jgi:glycosyltransferase involved in cell wall biosynthesis
MTKQRARVVFVATDLSTGGGVNRAIRDLAGIFAHQLRLEVAVASLHSRPSYGFDSAVRLQFRPRGIFAYIRELWRIRRNAPDWVFGSWTQDNILLLATFLFSGTRVIVTEHASWSFHGPVVRALRRLFYPLAYRVIALNPEDLAYYARHLRNVELIPNVVRLPRSVPREREKLIVAIGHLSALKNFGDAVRAMSIAGLEQKGWSLTIIGQGSERDELAELGQRLGLSKMAIETGAESLADWYARASLILVPSLSEVFSLVLAEAMAAGVVPIAYATDGPAFLLSDFPDNLVPIGDVGAMAERMTDFARAGDLQPVRDALRKSIESRFAPELIAAEWRRVLQ